MDTLIFEYRDAGGRQRFGDPWAIERQLRQVLGRDPWRVLAAFRGDDPDQALSAGKLLVVAVCKAFDLGYPFNPATGQGVKEAEWRAAFDAWAEWMEKNVFPASSFPTCSEPTPASPPATCSAGN